MLTSHRTRILAVVTAAALTLTACGGDDAADTAAQAGSTESTGGAVLHDGDGNAADGDGNADGRGDKGAKVGSKAGSGAEGSGSGDGEVPQVGNPLEGDLQIEKQEPVDGEAAGEQDAAEITAVIDSYFGALGNPDTKVSDLAGTIIDNSCSAVLDAAGGPEEIRNAYSVDATLGEAGMPGGTHTVEDVRVDGDNASAFVNLTMGGAQESNYVRLVREDGRWLMCDS